MDSLQDIAFVSSIAGNNLIRADAITHIERRRGTNRVVVAVLAAGESTAVWQSEIVNDDAGHTEPEAFEAAWTEAASIMRTIANMVASGRADIRILT